MASTNKAVYVRLDGRGTTSRGNTFKHLVYRNLGTMEIDDQIAGAKYSSFIFMFNYFDILEHKICFSKVFINSREYSLKMFREQFKKTILNEKYFKINIGPII